MRILRRRIAGALAAGIAALAPAAAEVTASGEAGFSVRHEFTVAAPPSAVWRALVDPASWWSSAHTWSGEAKNLSLQAKIGGCWCEKVTGGTVRHLTVESFAREKSLVLSGGLGPMHRMGVAGTLSFEISEEGGGAKLVATYAVGGFFGMPAAGLAGAVDGVIGEQVARLKQRAAR